MSSILDKKKQELVLPPLWTEVHFVESGLEHRIVILEGSRNCRKTVALIFVLAVLPLPLNFQGGYHD